MTDRADRLTLRPRRTGTLAVTGILAAVTAAFLPAAIALSPFLWILFGVSACALGVVAFASLPGRSYLRLRQEGFDIRTAFRERQFVWRDVTPFVVVSSARGDSVVFRARFAAGGALPPAPEPTDEDRAEGAEALPAVQGHGPRELAALMNDWRARARI